MGLKQNGGGSPDKSAEWVIIFVELLRGADDVCVRAITRYICSVTRRSANTNTREQHDASIPLLPPP